MAKLNVAAALPIAWLMEESQPKQKWSYVRPLVLLGLSRLGLRQEQWEMNANQHVARAVTNRQLGVSNNSHLLTHDVVADRSDIVFSQPPTI